jgi:hypothetical protein
VTPGVRLDEHKLADELITAGVHPVIVTTGSAVQKQERISHSFRFVIHFDAV